MPHPARWTTCSTITHYYGGPHGGSRSSQHIWANLRERQSRASERAALSRARALANAGLTAGDLEAFEDLDVWVSRRSIAWDLW